MKDLFAQPPGNVIELRAFTHGLPPKQVEKNLQLFFEEWRVNGVDAWNTITESAEIFLVGDEDAQEKQRKIGWWSLPEVLGDRFISRLLNAEKSTCILMPNITQIFLSILSCKELNQPKRRKIICTDREFPAVKHSLYHFNRQFENYSKVVQNELRLDIKIVEVEQILAEIDDSTALVVVSHVGFLTGERISDEYIQKIAQKAHAHGALVAVDGFHAIGCHRIDVKKLEVDLYFAGLLKEGCGSSGNCFLYIRPNLQLSPSLSGWFGDKQPFEFLPQPQINPSVRRRFLLGTTNIASYYHGFEGIKIIIQRGIEKIAQEFLDKVEAMTKILLEAEIPVISPHARSSMSGMLILEIPEAEKFKHYLAEHHGILVDTRKNQYVRLSPYIYNTDSELKIASKAIIECFQDKKYLHQKFQKTTDQPVT